MPINFFDSACQTPHITSSTFGICDNQDGNKAYVDQENTHRWIAVVNNSANREITFTAIDNCIDVFRANGEMESRCDGMLTTEEQIIFVELKDQRTKWLGAAIKQLETTISYFIENHEISIFCHKKAFACNRHHPHFQVLDSTQKQRFYNKFRVRLNVQAKIVVS